MGAELCFYYGFSHDEVSSMDHDTVFMYHKALKALRSDQMRGMIEASTYPHLKNTKDRESVQTQLQRAVRLNVSDGDYDRERELERILEARNGQ